MREKTQFHRVKSPEECSDQPEGQWRNDGFSTVLAYKYDRAKATKVYLFSVVEAKKKLKCTCSVSSTDRLSHCRFLWANTELRSTDHGILSSFPVTPSPSPMSSKSSYVREDRNALDACVFDSM